MRRKHLYSDPNRVEHIELDESNTKRRWILVILLLAIGVTAIGVGLYSALSRKSGWTEIEPLTGAAGCGAEFRLQYDLPEKNTTAVFRSLTALYTSACERAAKVYDPGQTYDGVGNLCTVNRSPNKAVKVEPELYAALERIQASGNRVVYLAPLYEIYYGLFVCTTDEEAAAYDPLQNPAVADHFRELAAFANDPEQIHLELLGDQRVKLNVSEAYLQYAEENGVESFLDLAWMKNAFITDDLAAALREQGFTDGYLQSYDGFGCNLCRSQEPFGMTLFDRAPNEVRVVAELEYRRPITFAALRSYAVNPNDSDLYYETENGASRAIYLDPADGQPKTAINDLMLWSGKLSCSELVLCSADVFTAEQFDPSGLQTGGLCYAYCDGREIVCNDPDVRLLRVLDGYTLRQD